MTSLLRTTCVALSLLAILDGCTSPSPAPAKAAQAEAQDTASKAGPDRKAKPEPTPTTAAQPTAAVKAPADGRVWNFDDGLVRSVARGFAPKQTGETVDPAAIWAIVAEEGTPSEGNAFGVIQTVGTNKTFNVALAEGTAYKDFELGVMLRAVSGVNNRGGGLVFRARGEHDYYVARWNPVENNFRLYALLGGARVDIASAPLELDPAAWHHLRVVVHGDTIECFVDDASIVRASDKALPEAGMIGLWTKGDAGTLFDDLVIDPE